LKRSEWDSYNVHSLGETHTKETFSLEKKKKKEKNQKMGATQRKQGGGGTGPKRPLSQGQEAWGATGKREHANSKAVG